MVYVKILSDSQLEIRCKGCGTLDILDYVINPNKSVCVKVEASYTACLQGCCWLCDDCRLETHLLCSKGKAPLRLL